MHQIAENSTFSIEEITKVEGAARLDVEIKGGKVESVHFGITEFKRFYTQAMRGKPIAAIPQLLSRICGTCSNAHLLASIEAVEKTLGVVPSEQTRILRVLTYHGLIIRDHALHLYLFALPDIFRKDSLLDFDETNKHQHQLLHDAFAVKAAGNQLAILVAGRSVHAPFPVPGGFSRIPGSEDASALVKQLLEIRPAVLRLIGVFLGCSFTLKRKTKYFALISENYSYLEGKLMDDEGEVVNEEDYRKHLEHVVIPYSHASGYTYKDGQFRVGALARMNINRHSLHPNTRRDAAKAIERFPSHDIFDNNLAQAIEILHSIDDSIDLLSQTAFVPEKPKKMEMRASVGVGVVEAPRGTLYHKLEIDGKGIVIRGEVIVPTGQNQIAIEHDLKAFIQDNLHLEKEKLSFECEKIIRAYDPCMSCGAHFLKLVVREDHPSSRFVRRRKK